MYSKSQRNLKVVAPKNVKNCGRPKSFVTVGDVYSLNSSKPITPAIEKMVSHVIDIKMGQSVNKTVQFKFGGSHALTLTLTLHSIQGIIANNIRR